MGKSHIIQVTNIGYDVSGDHSFDLQIPGAGQGILIVAAHAVRERARPRHVLEYGRLRLRQQLRRLLRCK